MVEVSVEVVEIRILPLKTTKKHQKKHFELINSIICHKLDENKKSRAFAHDEEYEYVILFVEIESTSSDRCKV